MDCSRRNCDGLPRAEPQFQAALQVDDKQTLYDKEQLIGGRMEVPSVHVVKHSETQTAPVHLADYQIPIGFRNGRRLCGEVYDRKRWIFDRLVRIRIGCNHMYRIAAIGCGHLHDDGVLPGLFIAICRASFTNVFRSRLMVPGESRGASETAQRPACLRSWLPILNLIAGPEQLPVCFPVHRIWTDVRTGHQATHGPSSRCVWRQRRDRAPQPQVWQRRAASGTADAQRGVRRPPLGKVRRRIDLRWSSGVMTPPNAGTRSAAVRAHHRRIQ